MLLLTASAGFVQASNIDSESFPLVESASVSRSIFANEGDRLVGNFTVLNIPSWIDSITGNSETIQYAFKISKIEGSEKCPTDIVLYEIYQTEHASFNLYCEYTGNYRLRFNVGSGAQDLGIGNMQATLNYDVVKNSSQQQLNISLPTPTLTPLPKSNIALSPSPSIPEIPSWIIPMVLSIILAVSGLLVYHKKHKQRKFS
jgi:hypothetical protein